MLQMLVGGEWHESTVSHRGDLKAITILLQELWREMATCSRSNVNTNQVFTSKMK